MDEDGTIIQPSADPGGPASLPPSLPQSLARTGPPVTSSSSGTRPQTNPLPFEELINLAAPRWFGLSARRPI